MSSCFPLVLFLYLMSSIEPRRGNSNEKYGIVSPNHHQIPNLSVLLKIYFSMVRFMSILIICCAEIMLFMFVLICFAEIMFYLVWPAEIMFYLVWPDSCLY